MRKTTIIMVPTSTGKPGKWESIKRAYGPNYYYYDRKQEAVSVLNQLNEKYENSADLANLRLSHLEILLQDGTSSEAKSHIEKCIIGSNFFLTQVIHL